MGFASEGEKHTWLLHEKGLLAGVPEKVQCEQPLPEIYNSEVEMLFHYVGGALMCEIRIKGLTHNVDGWTVHNWWKDRPTDRDYVDYGEDCDYGGYHHFVCESLSREAAQRIVAALGGYLVDDWSSVPASRQLAAGGPFWAHSFYLDSPVPLGRFEKG